MKWLVLLLMQWTLCFGIAHAQHNVPEIPFDSVADFFKLPEGMHFGEVPGVAVNSKGHVFVFTRANSTHGPAFGPTASQLLEFNAKGEFVREIGKGLYGFAFAHTVRIDRDDNIWTVDKGSDMVVKFNPAGRVQMVFGRRMESTSPNTKPHAHVTPPRPAVDGLFREPTDVAWDREGNIYITDGYINSRVAKYTSTGDWVKQWGEYGMEPGQFRTPHAIAIDNNNHIYVGDRSNTRVQVFDTDGKFLRKWQTPEHETGRPTGLSIDHRGRVLVADTHYYRVLIYSREGELLQTIGGQRGNKPGQFGWVTDVVEGRRDARVVAVTSGGTIPDRGLYGVFLHSGQVVFVSATTSSLLVLKSESAPALPSRSVNARSGTSRPTPASAALRMSKVFGPR